ncbi:MFS general substrate transporter [Armillaria gallica]|uniref:MFS general substrate transporter n=1 Tax=Armillaria gallica TaxID=47427 RepID=A0A2H3EKA5_ARMGA|nr:MFS general substrate transporter [Armillaria gallica]
MEKDTIQTFKNTPALERALVRKLDMRVLSTMFLILIMNYVDRNVITTARLKGLESDLGLTGLQYSIIHSVLYATYCPAQVPSNMALNYIKRPSGDPRVPAVPRDTGARGVSGQCLGLLDALKEGRSAMYLLSRWYTKELAFRSAILYSGLLISNAFGSLMAAGILSEMEDKRGIRAWRWLFYIEGSITICIGLMSMWLLPDYPHNTCWMSPQEQRLAQARIAEDAGEADMDNKENSPLHGLKLALKDPLVYVFSIMNATQLLGLSFDNFFPTLMETLGFSTTSSLLLCAPPWVFSAIVCCSNAWHADRTGERFFHMSGWWWGVIVGFITGLSTMHTGARYVSLFLMACGYAGFGMTLVWVSNVVVRPPAKRAVAMGIVSGSKNLGNLMGSYTRKADWGPEYHQSTLAALVFSTVLSVGIRQSLVRENQRLDKEDTED